MDKLNMLLKKVLKLERDNRLFKETEKKLQAANLQLHTSGQQLKSKQETLIQTQKIARVGSWEWDVATDTVTWSDELFHLFRLNPEDGAVSYADHPKIYTPDSMQRLDTAVQYTLKAGEPFEIDVEIIKGDGTNAFCTVRSYAKKDENGKVVQLFGSFQDITERKNAEEELKKIEERLRTIIDNSPFPIAVVDEIDNHVQYWSKSAIQLFGHKPKTTEEWYKLAYPDPEYRQEVIKRWKTFIEIAQNTTDAINTGEYKIHCKNGSVKICELYAQFIPGSLVVTLNDITKRKNAEEHLKELNQQLIANEQQLSAANQQLQASEQQLRAANQQLITSELQLLATNRQLRANEQELMSANQQLSANEQQLRAANQQLKASEKGLVDANKKLLVAKEEVEKSEKYLQNIIENIADPIFVKDEDSKLLLVNDAFCQLFGLNKESILGKTLVEDVAPAEQEIFLRIDKMVLENGVENINEETLTIRGGLTKIITTKKSRFLDDKGRKFLIGIIHDITERKQSELELIKAKEKAEEGDRLKSAFLANMSHEIRTPMNGILGFTSLLQEPNLTIEEQLQFIEIIQKSGNRLLSTVNDIIDISRIESGIVGLSISEINIYEQLKYLYSFFKPEAAQNGTQLVIKNEINNHDFIINTDPEKLNSILTNLIKNAIKFTSHGSIEMGYSLKNDNGQNYVEFYVKDTGIGVPKDRLTAIFDRFVQADIEDKHAKQGSGLGLAISKAYAEMLGGRMWVDSKVGLGSTFYFSLKAIPNQT